jgi:Undecaprenyl-phosphate glucose phosphotransferase
MRHERDIQKKTMTAQDVAEPGAPAPAPAPRRGLGERARAIASRFGTRSPGPWLAKGVAAGGEAVLLTTISLALTAGMFGADAALRVLAPVLLGTVLTILALKTRGGYWLDMLRNHQTRLGRALVVWSAVCGALSLVMLVGHLAPDIPNRWYPLWYLAGLLTFGISGVLISRGIRRQTMAGNLKRRAVIVGGGPMAESLIQALVDGGGNELEILGIFDDRDDERSPESQTGHPKLGAIADLVEFARMVPVDLVIVALPMSAETRLLQVLKQLWVLPVDIRLSAHGTRLRLRPRSYSYIGRVPFLDLFDRPIAGWDSVIKRVFDVVFATAALVALSPVMLAVALAVKLDSKGPVLFRQKRYGFNNEVIDVLKFRSMYHEMADPSAKVVVTREDPRVTRVGRFIRRTSLDELPQFFNVLRGELSLVGPRPHAVNAHTSQRLWEEVVDGYFARHKVKPGVTGWAQVNGWRGEVDTKDKIQGRVEHDLHYIENWSVFFDLYILMLTPIRILNQDTAY